MTRTGVALMAAGAMVVAVSAAQAGGADGRSGEHWGPHGGGFRGAGPEAAARVLNLTEAQRTAWDTMRTEHWNTIKPLMEEARRIHDQMRQQLDGAQPDAEAVGKLAISAHALGTQIEAAHQDLDRRFTQLLDADQKAKYEMLKQLRPERRGPGHGHPEGVDAPREGLPER